MEIRHEFGLSSEGIYKLACQAPLSRYLGVMEISSDAGPILDVLLDTTTKPIRSAVLACVKRKGMPADAGALLSAIVRHFGGLAIS